MSPDKDANSSCAYFYVCCSYLYLLGYPAAALRPEWAILLVYKQWGLLLFSMLFT